MIDVLITGAGPTGLALALWPTKHGVTVRIIDKSAGPGETSRAMTIQARTLELYRQLDIAAPAVAAGHQNPAINMWVRGKRKAHISFGHAGQDLTPYPFMLVFPQDQHERLLVERLISLGIKVERRTELLGFDDHGDRIVARLRTAEGGEETCEARYLAGCDGARSTVRHAIGAGFAGGTYKQVFYVADVEATGIEPADEIHGSFEGGDFVALFSYGDEGLYRFVGTVNENKVDTDRGLSFDDVGHLAAEALGARIGKVNWFSTYRVHHRVTDRFRQKRAFLLGDAAHVHSPAGGQGMNTGIGDAINLAWKLAAVIGGRAPDALLDSYQAERMAFARKLVDTTDRMFSFVAAEGGFAEFLRLRIAPVFMGLVDHLPNVQEFGFRLISQTMLNYNDSPVSEGKAGTVKGGDRLPWVSIDGTDNYGPLSAIAWQVHVYGAADADLSAWCERNGVPLHVFAWHDRYGKAGLKANAAYLLRPDTYVALADADGSPDGLARYAQTRQLAFG